MKSIKQLNVEEVIDEGIPYLVILGKRALSKPIAKKLGFKRDKKNHWYRERPEAMVSFSKLLERLGYRMRLAIRTPVKARGSALSLGHKLLKLYLKKKKKLEAVQNVVEKIREKLSKLVRKKGAHFKLGTDDSLLVINDYRVHYQFTTGRRTWDGERFGVRWLREAGHRNVLMSAINHQEWDKLKATGSIPIDVVKKAESRSDPHYSFVIRKIADKICPVCSEDIHPKDKFCSNCGFQLKKGK